MPTARVNRVYHDGIAMVPMELKTRFDERVYASYIVELSAQRLANVIAIAKPRPRNNEV